MDNNNIPATEAVSYEFAFHVLPTVAEGEVAAVFQKLKDAITKAGGELGAEEAPQRFELAYPIVKHLEGRNRKFTSAYFGWVRFTLESDKLAKVQGEIEDTKELLRHLLIRLTRVEAENPFFFHEALASEKVVETIDVSDEDSEETDEEVATEVDETDADTEDNSEDEADKVE